MSVREGMIKLLRCRVVLSGVAGGGTEQRTAHTGLEIVPGDAGVARYARGTGRQSAGGQYQKAGGVAACAGQIVRISEQQPESEPEIALIEQAAQRIGGGDGTESVQVANRTVRVKRHIGDIHVARVVEMRRTLLPFRHNSRCRESRKPIPAPPLADFAVLPSSR